MEIKDFLHLIRNKIQTILIVTIIFVLFAVAFTFVQPLRYSSVSKVLVIQSMPKGVESYQISKSNEYVASLLTQVISTNSFYKEVINSGFNIDKSYFPESGDKLMKLWKKTVKASSNANGIITIKVYHNNRVQVNQISKAIDFILKTKHKLYHGFGDLVNIAIIEQPVTSDRPIKPNVFINVSVAFIFGILVSLTYIYLFPDSRYDLHLISDSGDNLASSDIEPNKDEFEIKNYNSNSENNLKEASYKATQEIQDAKKNDFNLEEEFGEGIKSPSNLPVVDSSEEAEISEDLASYRPRNIEEQGDMNNIINQSDQRS